MTGAPAILVERDNAIATVSLSNPGKLNALTVSMWQELARVMDKLSADDALQAIAAKVGRHFDPDVVSALCRLKIGGAKAEEETYELDMDLVAA